MQALRIGIAALLVACLAAACVTPQLAPVKVPLPVSARIRPLDDYGDSLLSELSRVLGVPGLPASERLIVSASPKVELLLLIAGLATGWDLYPSAAEPNALRSSAEEMCRGLAEHDAVRHMRQLKRRGFNYDAVPRLALCYSDPPAMEPVYPMPRELWSRGGEELPCFMVRAAAFAEAADWQRWWTEREGAYAKIEERCRLVCESSDILGYLESYFGAFFDALVVIPSAMTTCGFGGTMHDTLGTWSIAVIGPMSWDWWLPELAIEMIVLHEAAHAFINPLTEAMSEPVQQLEHLYAPIARSMIALASGGWDTALNEHIIRAFGARHLLHTRGLESAESLLKSEEELGFRYIRFVYNQLAIYEAHRDEYPDFRSFYPKLLLALKSI